MWQRILFMAAVAVVGEMWRQDITSQMEIGVSSAGYRQVQLLCGADYMQVNVETEDDFAGVIYTRGSYHKREAPCFLDAANGRAFSLRIPLTECNTKLESDVYSNVVVIQHDDELIMPGDSAFTLECDFSKPRDVSVSADLRPTVSSRISITDADPAGKQPPRHQRSIVSNESETVVFTPGDVRTPSGPPNWTKET